MGMIEKGLSDKVQELILIASRQVEFMTEAANQINNLKQTIADLEARLESLESFRNEKEEEERKKTFDEWINTPFDANE